MGTVRTWTGREAGMLRAALRLSVRDFAALLGVEVRTVTRWQARGSGVVLRPHMQAVLDTALGRAGEEARARFAELARGSAPVESATTGTTAIAAVAAGVQASAVDDEDDAFELSRRVAASDVGEETLQRLDTAFDDLATRYCLTPPGQLLARVRRQLRFVADLVDAPTRKTLDEHRRLLVVGGWLSLLGATLHIGLAQPAAGAARLATARTLARQAGHDELHAWTYETRAWDALVEGRYRLGAGPVARRAADRPGRIVGRDPGHRAGGPRLGAAG